MILWTKNNENFYPLVLVLPSEVDRLRVFADSPTHTPLLLSPTQTVFLQVFAFNPSMALKHKNHLGSLQTKIPRTQLLLEILISQVIRWVFFKAPFPFLFFF